jgi:1-acyl-sn-glycerol-3-phosphate acyltransferase
VIANHQSWGDIVLLQHVLNRRIPFLRFFLKRSLIYVPLLGWAWWALDFPFMQRHSKAYLQKYPQRREQDRETTRRTCERFRDSHISVLNFIEGTRLTPDKLVRQNSPYQNLLIPKAGGIAFVLDAMGEQFEALLDVTIVYPGGVTDLWSLISGRVPRVIIDVRKIPIPPEMLGGNYFEDKEYRVRMANWIRQIWEQKDQLISSNR